MLRTIINVHVYIILDFPITYINASVLCQSECACLHKTINMVAFFVKSNENTYPKGRALMQIYRVVPKTKRGSWLYYWGNKQVNNVVKVQLFLCILHDVNDNFIKLILKLLLQYMYTKVRKVCMQLILVYIILFLFVLILCFCIIFSYFLLLVFFVTLYPVHYYDIIKTLYQ